MRPVPFTRGVIEGWRSPKADPPLFADVVHPHDWHDRMRNLQAYNKGLDTGQMLRSGPRSQAWAGGYVWRRTRSLIASLKRSSGGRNA